MKTDKADRQTSVDARKALSPASLAKRWGCCRQTIYNMIVADELHSFKVRNSRLIHIAEIERIERGGDA